MSLTENIFSDIFCPITLLYYIEFGIPINKGEPRSYIKLKIRTYWYTCFEFIDVNFRYNFQNVIRVPFII